MPPVRILPQVKVIKACCARLHYKLQTWREPEQLGSNRPTEAVFTPITRGVADGLCVAGQEDSVGSGQSKVSSKRK
ncbi:hypothetical protein SLE2022_228060 [Rubroshorea leprosula]